MGFRNRISKIFKSRKEEGYEYLNELVRRGGNVVLDCNMRYGIGENYWRYDKGVEIRTSTTIDGNGYCINAQRPDGYKFHAFEIFPPLGSDDEFDVVIKNITIENASFDGKGAISIYKGANVTIMDSFFRDNDVAIHNMGGNLTIINCEFEGNSRSIINNAKMTIEDSRITGNVRYRAISNTGEARILYSKMNANEEGAIINDGEMLIGDCHIQKSKASSGGAIENNGMLEVASSTISDNTSEENGAAILNNASLTVSSSTFSNNSAGKNGGAIMNLGRLDMTDATFSKNRAVDGAVIFNRGGCEIEDSRITENSDCESVVCTDDDSLKIRNTTFKSNKLKGEDSNVVINKDKAYLGIFDSKFIDNSAGISVLSNEGEDCTVSKTLFENSPKKGTRNIYNSSDLHLITPKVADEGKSILNCGYISLKDVDDDLEDRIDNHGTVEEVGENQIESSDFTNLDEIIHSSDGKEIVLTDDIVLKKREVAFYEGGIELDIEGLTIDGNGKTIDGADKSRIFLITANDVTLKNITFKNGYSHKNYKSPINENGGCIEINKNLKVTIEDCRFTSSTAGSSGGAINNKGDLTVKDSELSGNSSKSSGGAINNKGTLVLENTTLSDNSSETAGAVKNSDVLTVMDSKLSGNSAQNGGAIHSTGKTTISKSRIFANKANTGGAISQDETGILTIDDAKLCDNTAEENGGAISSTGTLTLKDAKLSNNKSVKRGGAIYNTGELFIIVSTFSANVSEDYGGAIENTGKLNIMNSTFSNNNAEAGSAISNYSEEVTVSDSNFLANVSSAFGTIENRGHMNIDNSIFTKNVKAIHNDGGMKITNSTLTDNTSSEGGAIDNDKSLSIINCKLSNNTAENIGGAIINSGHLSIDNCDLINNKAKRGGVIFNTVGAKNLSVENSTFSNNNASQGGAIFADVFTHSYISETVFITQSSFINNSSGAIMCIKYNVEIKECEFEGNAPKDITYIEVKDSMGF